MLTIARVWVPELVTEVEVKEVVSLITVTLSEAVGVEEVEEVVWAAVERMREAYRRRGRRTLEWGTRASQGICMVMDVRRRERPREYMSGSKRWGMCVLERLNLNLSYICRNVSSARWTWRPRGRGDD
jgi:hypothetical protein